MTPLAQRALEVALSEIGKGETMGNNRGPAIDTFRTQAFGEHADQGLLLTAITSAGLAAERIKTTMRRRWDEYRSILRRALRQVGIKPPAWLGTSDSWCAAFVSACYRRAAGDLGIALPFETSAGAKRLARNIAAAGSKLDPVMIGPRVAPPAGSIICWHRGLGWTGHVGIIESYVAATDTLFTVEGNRGPKVERRAYPAGIWRKRLCRVAVV